MAVSAAGEASSVDAQAQQAKATTAYQQQLVTANNAETANQLSNLRLQQSQATESASRDTEKARLANQKARATAHTSAGDAGVGGNSVDALLQEYSANLGQYKEAVTRQSQLRDAGYQDQADSILRGARYQNLQINAPIAQPQYGVAALNFASDAFRATRDYRAASADKKV